MGMVPSGGIVQALTAGVDTQDDGFWYEIRAWGWGMDLESWQIRDGFVTTFDALRSILFEECYVDIEDVEYYMRLVIQDAMGHRTDQVYDFVRMYPGRIQAFQGVDTRRMTQPYTWSNIEFYPGTKKPIPGGIKLLRADVNYYKNVLAGKLLINPEDPGAWHLHGETTEEWARHMCAEYENEKGIWECPEGKANHGWDCSVMNLVAADVCRFKFQKPLKEEIKRTREKKRENGWIPRQGKWLKR
jgi:phage terminase large subunit GpA-like protein